MLGMATQSHAQTFLKDLQQKRQGEGTVTVRQSADIDDLVNNAKLQIGTPQATQQDNKPKPATPNAQGGKNAQPNAQTQRPAATAGKPNTAAGKPQQGDHKGDSAQAHKPQQPQGPTENKPNTPEHKSAATEHKPAQEKQPQKQDKEPEGTVDTSKKMMRNARKVTGYRIQAFSGGNSRADREKATSIGDAIKRKYPEQPVYVHFYSPRWICRVGNFRSYEEAAQVLKGIKAMGYKQACIVKGKITVF